MNASCSKGTGDDYDAGEEFSDLINAVIAHEALHVEAVVEEAARHDLHAIWDGIVGSGDDEAGSAAINAGNKILDALQQASS